MSKPNIWPLTVGASVVRFDMNVGWFIAQLTGGDMAPEQLLADAEVALVTCHTCSLDPKTCGRCHMEGDQVHYFHFDKTDQKPFGGCMIGSNLEETGQSLAFLLARWMRERVPSLRMAGIL